jgi:transposase
MTGSPLQGAYTWLEPDEGKLSCPVLRGGRSGNASSLPDFNGLFGLVRGRLESDPLSGHLYLFANARRDRMKVLFFDGSGLWVCARRMEGGRLRWPEADATGSKVQLSREQFALLVPMPTEANFPRRSVCLRPILYGRF